MRYFVILMTILLSSIAAHAQYQGDDVYDPFADYSEFEENSQEEADIHFFKNGRFFNAAFMAGGRMFTGGMGDYQDASFSPGLYLAYFFNLRFALQFSYTFSEHRYSVTGPGFSPIEGNLSYSSMAFDLKYYFNTQNVTRGLADLNPYILGGFSQNFRTLALQGQTQVAQTDGAGFDFGAGIEVPIARNQMYVGAQFVYTYVNFTDENREIEDEFETRTGVFLNGDVISVHGFLGINF